MIDIVIKPGDLEFSQVDLPGFSGETLGAFPNMDVSKAPFLALLKMGPGAVLARHYHPSVPEAIYVVEGVMINDGKPLPAGSFCVHGPNVEHGPHTTETGCTLLFIQSSPVGPDDSVLV